MEGAILDRKLRHGHERTVMNLRKPIDFELRLKRTNVSFAQGSKFRWIAGYNAGQVVQSVRQQQLLKFKCFFPKTLLINTHG